MKKNIFLTVLFLSLSQILFSAQVPEKLLGIWEGKDRYVFFESTPDSDSVEVVIMLKEYYGWFIDRTAEPDFYGETYKRSRNSGTRKNPFHVYADFSDLSEETGDSKAWQVKLNFSKSDYNYIPLCFINNALYLDFFVKDSGSAAAQINKDLFDFQDEYSGLWRGNIFTKGLTMSPQSVDENIGCLFIADKSVYDVRYWLSDMDFEDSAALFSLNDAEFYAPKHIFSGENNYSCTNGRSLRIRNPQNGMTFSEKDYVFNEDKTLLAKDSEPYLIKLADKKTLDDLMLIVKNQNSKRKPPRSEIFPPSNLDFHWDLIDAIESDNELIQAVRKRQAEFGPRGKDLGK